jgi:acyl-CoA thioesterase-1
MTAMSHWKTAPLWLAALWSCASPPPPSAAVAPPTQPSSRASATSAPSDAPRDGLARAETPATSSKAKTDEAGSATPALPPPLPEGTTVLHVGDSMADALGKSLHLELKARGIKSILEAKEATYIPEWAGYKMKMDSHLRYHDPDLVIITLGGNETRMPDPTERVDAIKRLVAKVGDRPCLWIAAPLWPGLETTGILDVIRDNCAPCHYVDTNALIPDLERLGDGVHPTIPERRRWAKFMIRWLLQNRDPNGKRPWDFRTELSPPPADSAAWLQAGR